MAFAMTEPRELVKDLAIQERLARKIGSRFFPLSVSLFFLVRSLSCVSFFAARLFFHLVATTRSCTLQQHLGISWLIRTGYKFIIGLGVLPYFAKRHVFVL